jgi:hypothetical protein
MMRCMSCGEEMILAGVKPDDTGMVAGFKHETLHCLACRDTEHRFVYSRESSEQPELPPISALSQQPVISSSSVEAIASSPGHFSVQQSIPASPPESVSACEAIASVDSWRRAVEKLRSRQADIKMRTGGEKVEKTDWNARFNQSWLGPPHKSPGDCDATYGSHFVRKTAQALRIELWGSSPTGNRTSQSAIDPPATSIERFNRLWDSLLPARHGSDLMPEASTTSAKPLPRSLSLVQVENLQGVSVAGRAIFLLRR